MNNIFLVTLWGLFDMQWRRNSSDQGGGVTVDFWPHSFHETPIGSMLKFRFHGGEGAPLPLPSLMLTW